MTVTGREYIFTIECLTLLVHGIGSKSCVPYSVFGKERAVAVKVTCSTIYLLGCSTDHMSPIAEGEYG